MDEQNQDPTPHAGLPSPGSGRDLATGSHPLARPSQQNGTRVMPKLDFGDLLGIVLRWKWLLLGFVVAGIAAAILVTVLSTRVYRSTTTMEINTSPVDIMANNRSVQPKMRSEDQFLQTQFGLLKSRSLAERVEKTLNLAADPGFGGAPGMNPERRRLNATYRLLGNLQVVPVRGSNLVQLSYTDVDPERGTRIVNAFASGFIAATTERRYDATAYARTFLQTRLDATKQRLETSERQLVNYAQREGIVQIDPGSGGGNQGGGRGDGPTSSSGDSLTSQSLVALNGALSNAIGERIAAEQRYRQAVATSSTGETLQNPTVQALRGERARLEADYKERLATFKPDFPDMIASRTRIEQIDGALAREAGEISSTLRSAYLAALGREAELRTQVRSLRTDVLDLRNRGIGYTILQREVDTNRTLYDALLQRYKEIGVVGGLGESQATVVDSAITPRTPFKPAPFRNLVIGLAVGLVLGLAVVFGIEFVDDTIKGPQDVGEKLDLPVLGVVPRLRKGVGILDELGTPRSEVAEAYYSVMTALQFTGVGASPRSLLITSSRASEGKSSTSLALAQNFARTGIRVLLIDADLRKPSFMVKSDANIGLSRLLICNDGVVLHAVETKTPGLSLLPSGTVPPNPAELLATSRIRTIIEEAKSLFDVVVVDAPPVLGLADAPVLGSICDATLMVIEAASVRRGIVLAAIARLRAADARIVGSVLTKFSPKSDGYGYGYGYGSGAGYGGRAAAASPMLEIAS